MAIRSSSIIVELLDRVSGPARRAATSLRGLGKSARDLPSAMNVGTRLDAAMARNAAAMGRARLGVVDAVATYYALDAAIGAPIRTAAAFETQLEDIGQKAGIPVEQLAALGRRIQQVGRDTNQASSQIASAVDAMASRGADIDTALTVANPIGKAATAYRASTEDMAAAAWSAVDNLKVPADQVGQAIDMMASAGKDGAFELRDMAQYFPALGAAYQGLGQSGVEAVGDLAAALQVVRKGTGDSATAATNLQNVLQKMRSPATVRAFKRMGVSLEEELAGAAKRGLTPIEAIADVTAKTLDGDLSKLGYLFEDAQVQAGMRSLIQGMDEYQRIRDKAFSSKGVVDADYNRRIETANGAMERWAATTERFQISLSAALLPALSSVLDTITPVIDRIGDLAEAHPVLTKNVMLAAGAVVSLKGAMAGLRFVGLLGKGGILSVLSAIGAAAGGIWRAAGGNIALQRSLAAMSGLKLGFFETLVAGLRGIVQAIPGVSRITVALRGATTAVSGLVARIGAVGPAVNSAATATERATSRMASAVNRVRFGALMAGVGMISAMSSVPDENLGAWQKANREGMESTLRATPGIGSLMRGYENTRDWLWGSSSSGPRRAKGGPVSPGRTYLVGERGPEPFTPTRSGYVHPSGAGGGAPAVTVAPVFHITGGSGASPETIADQVMRRIEQTVAAALRGAMADVGG